MRYPPETTYARTADGGFLAYQVVGEGPCRLVLMPHWATHVEAIWEDLTFMRFMKRLGSFSEVLLFDKRGVGLSDPVSIEDLPTLESWMDDVSTVMAAVGWQDAAMLAADSAGPMAMLFAATHPESTSALVLFNTAARMRRDSDYPAGFPDRILGPFLQAMELEWGSSVTLDVMDPSVAHDAAYRRWQGRYQRQTASPGAMLAMVRMLMDVDVRAVLPAISTPTLVLHRSQDRYMRVGHGRYLAERIPGAKYVELSGEDHTLNVGDQVHVLDEIEDFLVGVRHGGGSERVLATVLFTDIVDSTKRAAEEGDRSWKELLDVHNHVVEREIERFRGRPVKTTGDGILATFDGPGRAIRCACTIRDALRALRVETRAGLHTGEIELFGADLAGIAVHLAQRVCALAGPGEVLVSRTAVDLVVGSGICFRERGEYDLKGVPSRWQLFVVEEA